MLSVCGSNRHGIFVISWCASELPTGRAVCGAGAGGSSCGEGAGGGADSCRQARGAGGWLAGKVLVLRLAG